MHDPQDHPEAFFLTDGHLADWNTGQTLAKGWTGLAIRKSTYFYVGRDGDETSYTALYSKTVSGARKEINDRGLRNAHCDRCYALVSNLPDSGMTFSTGGAWSANALSNSPELLLLSEAQQMLKKHPRAAILDVPRFVAAGRAYNEGFNALCCKDSRSTPASRIAAREAGKKALADAGYSLQDAFPNLSVG